MFIKYVLNSTGDKELSKVRRFMYSKISSESVQVKQKYRKYRALSIYYIFFDIIEYFYYFF